ncbi:nucleotidyltransferase substrate binding protein [Ralstonia pickettii]|nr:nucleotidyltransferase substrate binding protein [Ralstonia pickettii]
MNSFKDIRWRQRFENFEKSYKLLEKYSDQNIESEIEKAGFIQFFEMTFELSWKVLKDYLEAEGYIVNSPRETIKQAFQMGIIEDGHNWLEALSKRNLTTHTYNEKFAADFVTDIKKKYFPLFKQLHKNLLEE